jgi:stage II sporulation SpoE-like protein
MAFPALGVSGTRSRSAGRYRWVVVWLSIGCAMALLLLANAVRDYAFVSRILAIQQVRHQMTQIAAEVEQRLRRNDIKEGILQSALAGSPRGEESINLRNTDGVLLEHLGRDFPHTEFSREEEHNAFSRREALFRTLPTSSGDVVVEVFPMRPGRRPVAAPSGPATADSRLLLLEIAMPLKDADAAVLTPIRRNLIINLAAGLSLLTTVLLAGAGLRSYVQGRRLEEQMEIARQVQSRLLPKSTLKLPGHQLSTEYKPSEEVGGDFYDVFPIQENGFAVLIGDVSGKGIPAALLMGVIHGVARTALWQREAANHEEASMRLNRLLCEHASGNRFASLFWCVYDQPLHSLRYVNAGHCPPILIGRRDGKLLTRRLDKGGPVLGLLPHALYEATTVEVASGDLLVMYSDGLTEATNAEGEEYGEDRLAALLHSHADESPAQIREAVLSSFASFASANETQDDLTFAIIRFGTEALHPLSESAPLYDTSSVVS